MKLPRRKPKDKPKKAKPIPYEGCWACALGRHGAMFDNTCTCCRNNHSGVR